jgi:hypothetical protein
MSMPAATPFWRADPHQVAWAIGWQALDRGIEHFRHDFLWLADAQPADRAAIDGRRSDDRCRLPAAGDSEPALTDAEQEPASFDTRPLLLKGGDVAREPLVCEPGRFRLLGVGGAEAGQHIECHRDVGAELSLKSHRPFGGEFVAAAIQMRAEGDTLLGDLAVGCQAEDLEPARIGQQRTIPAHEVADAAQ